MPHPIFNQETLVPIGLVLTMLAAAVSFGVMYQKVETLSGEVNVLRVQMAEANSKLDQLIGRQSVAIYGQP